MFRHATQEHMHEHLDQGVSYYKQVNLIKRLHEAYQCPNLSWATRCIIGQTYDWWTISVIKSDIIHVTFNFNVTF
jgi:hypothetical protein